MDPEVFIFKRQLRLAGERAKMNLDHMASNFLGHLAILGESGGIYSEECKVVEIMTPAEVETDRCEALEIYAHTNRN